MSKNLSENLRVGIVGAGIIGDAHATAISQLDDQYVVAIAEPTDQLREDFAAKFSVETKYKSWEELVADDRLDVVYIGTPNDLHLPIAVAAMESGKHVICEKPLARNLDEGKAMAQAARRTGKQLHVALNHRFMSGNQKVKQLLDEGTIGRPFLALSTFIGNEFERMNNPDNWKGTREKAGGGAVIDNGTHLIDLLRWWLGDAVAVTARCGRLLVTADNKEEDTAALAIEFAGGALAELSLTFSARYSAWPSGYIGAAIRNEIYASDGSIRVGGDEPVVIVVGKNTPLTRMEQSQIATGMPSSLQVHFADCIRGNAEPIVTVQDGVAALEIVDAAYRSAETGRRVVIG